jgi:hypothetical protein
MSYLLAHQCGGNMTRVVKLTELNLAKGYSFDHLIPSCIMNVKG